MNLANFLSRVWLLAIAIAAMAITSASAKAQTEAGKFSKPTGYAALESGQFVRYKYKGEDWRYSWRQRAYVNMGTEMELSERFKVSGGLSAFMWYNTFPKERNNDNLNFDEKHVDLDISSAEGTYIFGELEHPLLELSGGIFPYKYNQDSRNLGEYLFRSGAYPNYILGDFDYSMAQLTGFKISSTWLGNWKNDLMLTTETDMWPHFDMNLSYLTHCGIGKFLDIGAGISLTNLISVDADKTTPNPNLIKARNGDAASTYHGYVEGADTLFYTFKSTKLMARMTLDPLATQRNGIFGEEDLKLYAEIAVLGWKNYPRPPGFDTLQQYSFFENRSERMPVMVGFNLPAFGWLDVLSLELEWYGLKGPNSFRDRIEDGFPLPQSPTYWATNDQKYGIYTASNYVGKDDIKWSVYAKKTVIPGLQVVGQIARDHVRHNFDSPIQLDREEALTKPSQWWWALKVAFFY